METSVILPAMTLVLMSCSALAVQGQVAPTPQGVTSQTKELKYLSAKERQQWSSEKRNQLLITKRQTGPFGLSQDLSVKKVAKAAKKVVKSDAFPKAIAEIKIHMVFGQSFVIGAREFRKGETFSLEHNKNTFSIKVSSVNTKQIIFKNVKTGEQVIKQLDAVPEGMERDRGFDAVPGVTPANQKKSEPIKIGGSESKKKK